MVAARLVLTFILTIAIQAAEPDAYKLPEKYAGHFLVTSETISPDKKFAFMFPTLDFYGSNSPEAKDCIIALHPFAILGTLETEYPYFEHESFGGLSARWLAGQPTALVTLDGKWGPRDIFLVEIRDGKLFRTTNLLAKAHDLLLPSFRAKKHEKYSDAFDFIFDTDGAPPLCRFEGDRRVRIDGRATNDPKGDLHNAWTARVTAVWDIQKGKLISQKISH